MNSKPMRLILAALLAAGVADVAAAQWTNRYPKVAGYGHHVYLEGYELPLLTNGPIDAAPSPDGESIAFAARGWLWQLDPASGKARRLTSGADIDSRPAWSPDGGTLAFVRDSGSDTTILALDLNAGTERVLVDTPAIDLDPAFTRDGSALLYASAAAGTIDLWRLDLESGESQRLSEEPGLELRPQSTADGGILYLAKTRGGIDQLRHRDAAGQERLLWQDRIASQARPALSPDGSTVAINVPGEDIWELRLIEIAAPATSIRIAHDAILPLTPAWSADGASLYFSQADTRQRMRLFRAGRHGGDPAEVEVVDEDWGAPTGWLRIRTRATGTLGFAAARLSVRDGGGHPVVPEPGQVWFDGQNGTPYFYSEGDIRLRVVAGDAQVMVVRGLLTPVAGGTVTVPADGEALLEVQLDAVADPTTTGWMSGDHHFHLNYGGPYQLRPQDLVPIARGEHLQVLTPLTANLHVRYEDREMWGWRRDAPGPLIFFGQEIRSHFLGHLGIIGHDTMIWPWIWGPGYEVYGRDDRANGEILAAARADGGIGTYMHPISVADPFADGQLRSIPTELVVDAVNGDLDAIELACLWSDEMGTSALWHELLNVGAVVVPNAGTDVMTNFYRTMAPGATRLWVRAESPTRDAYLDALRAGRSVATTGPMLWFEAIDADGTRRGPGEVIAGAGTVDWSLRYASATSVDRIEVLVNGQVAWSSELPQGAGETYWEGRVELPAGGWIAARAHGGEVAWPLMSSYPFAHTGPLWIGERGSIEPAAASASAARLLTVIADARLRLQQGYGAAPIPELTARFDRAEALLRALVGQ